jgi:hypothetical protein
MLASTAIACAGSPAAPLRERATCEGQPVYGLDRRTLSLARILDRLPAGEYQLHLTKSPERGAKWRIWIERVETLVRREIGRADDG